MKQVLNWLNPKNIITLVLFAGVLYLFFKFKDILSGKTTQELNVEGKVEKNTVSDEVLRQIAEIQAKAMQNYGTDEDILFKSLENLNGSDLKKVFNYFGTRPYESFTGGQDDFLGTQRNLFIWYSFELDKSDLNKMRKVWEKSKIPIPF